MADITITPASFVPSAGATLVRVTWGATIARGDLVYKNTSNVWVKAKADATGTYAAQGYAATDGASGQPGLVLTKDPALAIGATVAEGVLLAVSATTSGATGEVADIGSGEWLLVFGVMRATNLAYVDFPNAFTTASALS